MIYFRFFINFLYEIARLVYYIEVDYDWLRNRTGRDELKNLCYSDNQINW